MNDTTHVFPVVFYGKQNMFKICLNMFKICLFHVSIKALRAYDAYFYSFNNPLM